MIYRAARSHVQACCRRRQVHPGFAWRCFYPLFINICSTILVYPVPFNRKILFDLLAQMLLCLKLYWPAADLFTPCKHGLLPCFLFDVEILKVLCLVSVRSMAGDSECRTSYEQENIYCPLPSVFCHYYFCSNRYRFWVRATAIANTPGRLRRHPPGHLRQDYQG